MKKILIIQGHPNKDSFVAALAQSYQKAAEQNGHNVRAIQVTDIQANLIHWKGYKQGDENLEPDLAKAQADILWADHLVLVYPTWWSTIPALLKAFLERTLLPDFAFEYTDKKGLPKKLLKNKTARLLVTMDTPPTFFKLFIGHKLIKKNILGFCGIKPVKSTNFGVIRTATDDQRAQWLTKAKELGTKGI